MRLRVNLACSTFSIVTKRWRVLLAFATPYFSVKLQFRPDRDPMPEIGFNTTPGLPFLIFIWPVFFCFYTRQWTRSIVESVLSDGYLDYNQQRYLMRHPEIAKRLRDMKTEVEYDA